MVAHPDVNAVPSDEHRARLRVGPHSLAKGFGELSLARGILNDRDDEGVVESVVLDALRLWQRGSCSTGAHQSCVCEHGDTCGMVGAACLDHFELRRAELRGVLVDEGHLYQQEGRSAVQV